jgi:hypothetical protein
MDGVPVITASGILRPLTHTDYGRIHGRRTVAGAWTEDDYDSHVDWIAEHHADFRLLIAAATGSLRSASGTTRSATS